MIKKASLPILVAVLAIFYSCAGSKSTASSLKDDLRRLRWIEGNWYGMYKGKPFYEIYQLINDSTLRITSYNWNGKDSSGSSVSFLQKNNGTYYLGDSLNYKVTSITDSSIAMVPNYKANNSILWQKKSGREWLAVLLSSRGETVYEMKPAGHFKK